MRVFFFLKKVFLNNVLQKKPTFFVTLKENQGSEFKIREIYAYKVIEHETYSLNLKLGVLINLQKQVEKHFQYTNLF